MYALQKSTRLALYLLVDLTRAPAVLLTASGFAQDRGVRLNHVSKVLQRLCRAGFLDGLRGAQGGYRLRREPAEISMLEIVELFEGPAGSDCSLRGDGETCEVRTCNIHGVLSDIEDFAVGRLRAATIVDLAFGPLGPPRPGPGKRLPISRGD